MTYFIRPMRREDIEAVSGIDREVFPTLWPPVNYQNELKNRLAHYFVVGDGARSVETTPVEAIPEKEPSGWLAPFKRLVKRFTGKKTGAANGQYLVGFIGLWLMVDEAHVINIAVRESYRRQGIGELLFIRGIELALGLKARIVTLEVRASNYGAQALYRKYGLTDVGLRRGYYTDDKEDAILMSTDDLNTESFRTQFWKLKQKHLRRMKVSFKR